MRARWSAICGEDFVLSYGEQFVRDRLAADAEIAEGRTSSLDDVVAELDD